MILAARIGSAIYGAPQSCWRWLVTELTDFSGRLSPWQFKITLIRRLAALALLLVVGLGISIYLSVSWHDPRIAGPIFVFANWGCPILFAFLSVQPVIRRFHDLNLSTWSAIAYAWAIVVSYALVQRIPMVKYSKYSDDGAGGSSTTTITYPENPQDWPLFGLCLIPMLFIFVLLLWGGTKGPNRYGPQPE